MQRIKNVIPFLLLIVIQLNSYAEEIDSLTIYVNVSDKQKLEEAKLFEFFKEHGDSDKDINKGIVRLYDLGYLAASYEVVRSDTSVKILKIHVGEKYEWAVLDQGNLPDDILFKTGTKKSIFSESTVRFSKISKLLESSIEYSENNGYPFANARLTDLKINGPNLSAKIEFNPGPYIEFGEIIVSDNDYIKSSFISAYLGIKTGMAYDERKVQRIPSMIGQLPYLSLNDFPALQFSQGKCVTVLEVNRRKASSFDGIIGFLPNQNEPNKLLITGQVYLHIRNLFKAGKNLELDWQKPNALTQELSVKYMHANLLHSPLDLSFKFLLFKQDTSFINRDFMVGFQYTTNNMGKLGLTYRNESSRLLSTYTITREDDLLYADFDLNYYGLSYLFNNLNNLFFPTKGIDVWLNVDFGNKKIIKNSGIPDFLYESLELQSLQILAEGKLSGYFSFSRRHVMKTALGGGIIDNDQLFLNDLFRLGGIYSLRGFNEKKFFASKYLNGSLEYRFLFENQSYLLAFIDGAYYQEDTHDNFSDDFPFGIGGGMSISTRAGNLSLLLALGRSANQPFDFNYSKIHIGYSNRF